MLFGKYLYAATVVIILMEIAAGRHRGIYDRSSWIVGVGSVVANAAMRPLSALFIGAVIALILPKYQGVLQGSSLFWSYIAVFSAAEFCFYWGHRWAHEAKASRHDWLWKLHRTHHSGRFMNVGVTMRVNPFWSFVVPTPWVVGTALYLGLDKAAGLTVVTVYGWNLITHANFRWDDPIRRHRLFGPAFRMLEHALVSPGIHHTHHGFGKDGANYRNYAVTLSLFDWLFGTLHIPEGRPWRYGVPGPNAHWAEELLFPVVRSDRAGRLRILPRFRQNRDPEQ